MIKYFCDLCEEELAQSRVNRNNLIVPLKGKSIALAVNVDGVDEPSICEKCLFTTARDAKLVYLATPLPQTTVDAMLLEEIVEKSEQVIELKLPEENCENGGTHNEGKSTA